MFVDDHLRIQEEILDVEHLKSMRAKRSGDRHLVTLPFCPQPIVSVITVSLLNIA